MNDVIFSDVLSVPSRFRSFPSVVWSTWGLMARGSLTMVTCYPPRYQTPSVVLCSSLPPRFLPSFRHRLHCNDSSFDLIEHSRAIHSKDIHRQYVEVSRGHACCDHDLLGCHARTRDIRTTWILAKPEGNNLVPVSYLSIRLLGRWKPQYSVPSLAFLVS